MVDEMQLVGRLRDVTPLRPEAFEQARTRLRETMGESRRPPRRRAWAVWSTAGLGIAAAATAVALVITSGPQPGGRVAAGNTGSHATSPGAHAPLIRLAAAITARRTRLPGNATLILRTQVNAQGQSTGGGADLYTDSGAYYYAQTESGLPAQIAAHNDTGDGGFAREVAAARFAVHGNLATARERMAKAALDPKLAKLTWDQQIERDKGLLRSKHINIKALLHPTAAQRAAHTDNEIWENSLDAIQAGAGQPQVRAGVLRLLSTLPDITVRRADINGEATLTLTARGPAMPPDYQETLTINGSTGVPIGFAGGVPGHRPETTSTYRVSRVTVAAIAAGRF